jgi:RNA polymerase sigma-70 factor (ECF subfamily)
LNKTDDREVAKDIVQDLFVHIWNKGAELIIRDNVMAYLYTSAKNRVLDYYSKEKHRIAYLDYLEIADFEETYETDFLIREKMFTERIDQVLHKLSPRVKEVFELSRKHYLSHKEIATKLSLSEHSVKTYIKDALKLIKVRLYAFPWILLLIYIKKN